MEANTPEHVIQQVDALLQRQRTDQARALLKAALASHPDHTGLLLQAAWADYLDDRTEAALNAVRQVLVAEPENENARVLYFELLVEKEQHAEAERVIIELLREFPECAGYYGRYANLMLRTMNLTKATQLAHEGLKYDPDDAECLAARTICEFIEQRAGDASRGLQQMLVRHPQSVRTLLLVVVALEQRGDVRGAKRVAQELVRARPDNEQLVQIARQLNVNAHWSMLPMWPMQRWGWGASFAIWLLAILGSQTLSKIKPSVAGIFIGVVLSYVIYSWVWPALLRRLMK